MVLLDAFSIWYFTIYKICWCVALVSNLLGYIKRKLLVLKYYIAIWHIEKFSVILFNNVTVLRYFDSSMQFPHHVCRVVLK